MNVAEEERSVMQALRREIVQFRSDATMLNDLLCSTIRSLESQSEKLLDETKKKLNGFSNEFQQISEQYAELEYKLDYTRHKASVVENSLNSLENQCCILESSLDTLHQHLESLQVQMSYEEQSSVQQQISECHDKIGHVQKQLYDTECKILETRRMIQRLENEIEALTKQKEDAYQLKGSLYQKCCFYEEKIHKQEELFLRLQDNSKLYVTILRQTASSTLNNAKAEINALDGCIACIDQYITAI